MVSFEGSDEEPLDDSMSLAASDAEDWTGSSHNPAPLPSLEPIDARASIYTELIRVLSKAVEELGLEWSAPEEPTCSCLDEWFLPGHLQAPPQQSVPFFPEVHDELTKSWRTPYSAHLHSSASHAVTTVGGAEQKGYEKGYWMKPWPSTFALPPAGKKTKTVHPSKPCRTTSALAGRVYTSAGQVVSTLHSMVVLQVYQARLLCAMDGGDHDPAVFRELRSATDLALCTTKMAAQAIGRSMASVVVLECHLWLNLPEIKTVLLDSQVSPTGLFGPVVDGFAECFTKVVPSHVTLFTKALQLLCLKSSQTCADTAAQQRHATSSSAHDTA
ncbi:hypothetical protein DPX16_0152 [Anabarilius grahami]|uniref:Uncharacterized protein n=1 Tax=Anabarilius grahami TaxID=495550 RepID=A0A3N0ZAS4_ANAGA|nr:hypothetical protein DPX16_0152 [Anabarilius grahami]